MATYDRAAEDVGNIVAFEHVNVRVPDPITATIFYVMGLGFTRDPYVMVGVDNMWINIGLQQFHLPTGKPQVVRGHVGMVVPSLGALTARLDAVKERLAGTKFGYTVEDKYVSVTCPWGNRLRCYAPGPEFGDMTLGVPYVEFPVRPGDAEGVAKFYTRVFDAPAMVRTNGSSTAAHVPVGPRQTLIFRETPEDPGPYDGHHIAVYIANFSGPHRFLAEHGLVTEESNPHQYRFNDIVDPDTLRRIFTIEHEVRSITNPMWMRPFVNRNAAQQQRTYVRGRDAFVPGM